MVHFGQQTRPPTYPTPNALYQRNLSTMLEEILQLRRYGGILTCRKVTVEYGLVFLCIAYLFRCGEIFEMLKV
jgi:hypothetical protein